MIVIIYEEGDRSLAQSLSHGLRRRGMQTWSDLDLTPGPDWQEQSQRALSEASAMVVLVTPRSLRSDWVTSHWVAARAASRRVIMALADGAADGDLPDTTAGLPRIDLGNNLEIGLAQLATALAADDVSEAGGASSRSDSHSLVFVITSFDEDMRPAFKAIESAAQAVGLSAKRAKDFPGDHRILDTILTSIRDARIVVADLTHERPNVYFELGYARGLGKRVVTIMRAGTRPHFNVNDWPRIEYADSRPLEVTLVASFEQALSDGDPSAA